MSQMNANTQHVFDTTYQRYKRLVYDYSATPPRWCFDGWEDAEWRPQSDRLPLASTQTFDASPSHGGLAHTQSQLDSSKSPWPREIDPRHSGTMVRGTYDASLSSNPSTHDSYEYIDPAFYVRTRSFFTEGRVFALIVNETAGAHAQTLQNYNYNPNISVAKYKDNFVHTVVRRVVVVRPKHEFCYACPILTYSNRGTTKPGLRPKEHGVVYSWGQAPEVFPGEGGITKPAIPVVMVADQIPLHKASRIYYGIHYPIQYNVKVRDVGYVPPQDIPTLLRNWREEEQFETEQLFQSKDRLEIQGRAEGKNDVAIDTEENAPLAHWASLKGIETRDNATPEVTDTVENSLDPKLEVAANPRAFFKKGRVFMTVWAEPKGFSEETFVKIARFAVVKPHPTFSVCLRINTYSGQGSTKPGMVTQDHAAVIEVGGTFIPHPKGEPLNKDPIEIKVENPDVTIDPMSRMNMAKPYTVEHNVRILNIGRVVGASVGLLERYFAESLGYAKP